MVKKFRLNSNDNIGQIATNIHEELYLLILYGTCAHELVRDLADDRNVTRKGKGLVEWQTKF